MQTLSLVQLQVTVCESHSIPGGAAHAWVRAPTRGEWRASYSYGTDAAASQGISTAGAAAAGTGQSEHGAALAHANSGGHKRASSSTCGGVLLCAGNVAGADCPAAAL
jgi:hypothetical protein